MSARLYPFFIRSLAVSRILFKAFVVDRFPDVEATLLDPNIVDHVDYLIGGSVINASRNKPVRSKHWNEEELVNELTNELRGRT